MDAIKDLQNALTTLKGLPPSRAIAIAITDIEKVIAWLTVNA